MRRASKQARGYVEVIPGEWPPFLIAYEAAGVDVNPRRLWLVALVQSQTSSTRSRKRNTFTDLMQFVGPHQTLMDYSRFRSNDWQIRSGMIESTARHLVRKHQKARACWSEADSAAITAIRAQSIN